MTNHYSVLKAMLVFCFAVLIGRDQAYGLAHHEIDIPQLSDAREVSNPTSNLQQSGEPALSPKPQPFMISESPKNVLAMMVPSPLGGNHDSRPSSSLLVNSLQPSSRHRPNFQGYPPPWPPFRNPSRTNSFDGHSESSLSSVGTRNGDNRIFWLGLIAKISVFVLLIALIVVAPELMKDKKK